MKNREVCSNSSRLSSAEKVADGLGTFLFLALVVLLPACGARTELAGELDGGADDGGSDARPHVCRNGTVGDGVTCVNRSSLDDLASQACDSFTSRELYDAGGACAPGQASSELYHCCPTSCWSSVGQVNQGCEPTSVAEGRAPALCQTKGMSVDYVHSYLGTDPKCGDGMTTTTYVSCCP